MASIVMSARVARSLSWGAFAVVMAIILVLAAYAGLAYSDAMRDAPILRARADALIAAGRGAQTLGMVRLDQVIQVEDPSFWSHNGLDSSGAGTGGITITQRLAKPAPFDRLVPSVTRLRQAAYAYALETRLSKFEILALFLDDTAMGQGKAGPLRGLFTASRAVYGRAPGEVSDQQWLTLLAAINAPVPYHLAGPDDALANRVGRVGRLIHNDCQPAGVQDVALDGCAI